MKNSIAVLALVSVVVAALAGSISALVVTGNLFEKSQNSIIKEFYDIENAVLVSPHTLRTKMDKGVNDFVLVDLRSAEEYAQEHIISAVNVPAYSDPATAAYGDVERIAGSFRSMQESSPGKDIIVYCYSMPCMTGRKIGKMLAENGIYVKHLGIGWNEWRHFWTLWNHEYEWNITDVRDYIASGAEPGAPKLRNITSACREGDFSC